MPILASLGTANDRAFGFGDSSFKISGNKIFVNSPITVEALIVAGGGGGNHANVPFAGDVTGGGGGGGGVVYSPSISLNTTTTSTPYEIIVGAGGTAHRAGYTAATNGQNSSFAGLVAYGGGYGGGSDQKGGDGGCGGGGGLAIGFPAPPRPAGGSGVAGQGYDGATGGQHYGSDPPGGGGGAGATGSSYNGGIGYLSSITGTATYYAGGGGGGPAYNTAYPSGSGGLGGGGKGGYKQGNNSYDGENGIANTGGGGGGGSYQVEAGNGGSGVVILKYLTSDASKINVVGATTTTSGLYTISRFTEAGTDSYYLPNVITNNAEILYDISNPASYTGSGSTLYDISGKNRNAILTGSPSVSGTGIDKYFEFSGTGSDYVSLANFRDTSTENWTIHLIMSFSGGTAKEIIDGTKWGLEARNGGQLRAYPTVDFWVTGSSGGTNSYAGTKVLVSLTLTRSSNISQFETALNGSTTTVFNNQVSFADYVSTLAADFGKNGGNIYLYAGYKTSQAPTASQAYNALKGRFGL